MFYIFDSPRRATRIWVSVLRRQVYDLHTSARSMALDLCISLSANFTQRVSNHTHVALCDQVSVIEELIKLSMALSEFLLVLCCFLQQLLTSMRNLNADAVSSEKFHFVSITAEHVTAKLCL